MRTEIITVDTRIIISRGSCTHICMELLTREGGVVAISKFGGKYLLEEVSGSSPI